MSNGTGVCGFCKKRLDASKGEVDHGCLDCAYGIVKYDGDWICLHCKEKELQETKTKLKAIQSKLDKATEGLEFYGDRREWTTRSSGELPAKINNDADTSKAGLWHGGKKARETLEAIRGES